MHLVIWLILRISRLSFLEMLIDAELRVYNQYICECMYVFVSIPCLYYISLKNISAKTSAWLLVYSYWSLQRDHPAQFQSGRPWASKLTRVRLWMPRMDPLETSKPIRGCSGPDSDLWESLACGARRKAEYPFAWRIWSSYDEPPNQTVSCRYVKTTKRDEQPHACIRVKYSLNKLHQSLFYGKNSKLLVCVRLWVSELYCLI